MRLSKGALIFLASMVPVLPFGPPVFPYSFFIINLYWLFVSMPFQALCFNLLIVPLNIILASIYKNHSLFVFFMYCVGPTIYLFFRNAKWFPSSKLIRNFIIGSVIIGVVMNPTAIMSLRGIDGLYNEPSHFGRFVLGALILGSMIYSWKMLFPGAVILALNKSASGFVLWILSYAGRIFSLRKATLVKFAVIGALAVSLVIALSSSEKIRQSFRFLTMVNTWMNIAESDRDVLNVQTLQAMGSLRLPQIIVGYLAVTKYPLGQGAGSYETTLFKTSAEIGLDLSQISRYEMLNRETFKPTSYYSQIVYDFGVFGIAIISLFVAYTYRSASKRKNGIIIWLIGHYLLALNTTTTFPLPWILLGLVENRLWPNIEKHTERSNPDSVIPVNGESMNHSSFEV